MERSIENIWTKGFIGEDQLIAPKINDLYNKKSQLLLEKLKRTYRADNRNLLPLIILFTLGFVFMGHVILGVYVGVLLTGLYFLNRRNLALFEKIRIEGSSYDYLVTYRRLFFSLQTFYTRLLGLGLPVAGLVGSYLFFRNSPALLKLFQFDLLTILLITAVIAAVFSGIGVMAYKLSTKALYGNLLKKLDQIISEMEELRK